MIGLAVLAIYPKSQNQVFSLLEIKGGSILKQLFSKV